MDGDFHLRQWTGGLAWLNQRVCRLRPLRQLSALYLLLSIEAPIKEWNAAISGTTVAHLGKRHLERIRILVPPSELLGLVSPIFGDLAAEQCSLVQAARKLGEMRGQLLPRLVAGQIDVSNLDPDGSESVA